MLFDWLVTGQVVATNPAHSVRGPKHVVKTGKTTVLTGEQARELLDSIDTKTVVGLRDRALIGLLVFTFARIGAARPQILDLHLQGCVDSSKGIGERGDQRTVAQPNQRIGFDGIE